MRFVSVVICLMVLATEPPLADGSLSPFVSDKGEISLPKDFRSQWSHLGSWFLPEGGAAGFHDVYAQPKAVEAFRKTGKFPDGAVLVKELRGFHAQPMTTGYAHRAMDEVMQWFVMVKAEKNPFPGNPVWGDGWGWALIKPDNPALNIATDYKTDCLGCHVPAKDRDWVYLEGYPTLKERP